MNIGLKGKMLKQETVMSETTRKSSEKNNSLSRRDFLKLSGTIASVATLGELTIGNQLTSLIEKGFAQQTQTVQDEWIPTSCYMCDANCAVHVHVVNGVAVKIEGDPTSPDSLGRICGRSNAGIMQLYNAYRVKNPVKRTNPEKGRGVDPKWVEISWDEAINTVADRLTKIRQDDPRKFVIVGPSHRCMDHITLSRGFALLFGTPSIGIPASGGGIFCSGCTLHTTSSWFHGCFVSDTDMDHAMYAVMVGNGMPGKQRDAALQCGTLGPARGCKIVSVDPVLAPSGRKADEWIPIRPSTDAAFLLGITYMMLYELNTYDVGFIKKRTNGPYLIGPDGLYVRGKDPLVADPARLNQKLGKPYVWDPIDQKAKSFDDKTIKDYALDGTYIVDGVTCQPAFQLLKAQVKDYTPEWASNITTVPAATIRRITNELVNAAQIGSTITINGVTFPNRPASVTTGKGAEVHLGGLDVRLAMYMVNCLLGSMDVPGGLKALMPSSSFSGVPNLTPDPADGVIQPGFGQSSARYSKPIAYPPQVADLSDMYPLAYKTSLLLYNVIATPEQYPLPYKVEMILNLGNNAINGSGTGDFVAEAIAKVPFFVTSSYNFDEPTEMADIVLPEHSYLERYSIASMGSYQGGVLMNQPGNYFSAVDVLRQPVVKPVNNTRQTDEVLMDLAEKLGILYGSKGLNAMIAAGLKDPFKIDVTQKHSSAEIIDQTLKSTHGSQFGLDWFSKNGWAPNTSSSPQSSAPTVDKYYGITLYPNTRLPLYVEYLAWAGKEFKSELDSHGAPPLKPSKDFVFSHYRPLPQWFAEPNLQAPAEFDMWAIHYKTMIATMAYVMDNVWTGEVNELFDPYSMNLWMNRATAAAKGFKDGDWVWVESQHGKTRGQVRTSEAVHPEVIGMGGCYDSKSVDYNPIGRGGANINDLCAFDETTMNPVCGGMENRAKVKVYKG